VTDDGAVKVHYLDASALVKLVANDVDEEPGRAVLRRYFFDELNGPYYATSYCIAEALSGFKVKWLRKRISQDEYVKDVREFFRVVVSGLTVEEVSLSLQVSHEAERLMMTYGIDFIDSIQVVTVLKGHFSGLGGGSKSLFITADSTLAEAARREGARVWECRTETSPP
jgi:predicted nucleic acid-binding protein